MIEPLKVSIPLNLVAGTKKMSRYPIENVTANSISQPFGVNYVNFYRSLGLLAHNGTDFRCVRGTKVFCPFDEAEVLATGWDRGGGRFVEIATRGFTISSFEGSYRLRLIFYHLLKDFVGIGDWIKDGFVLALSDNSGVLSTGDHLHLGVKIEKMVNGRWETLDKDNGYAGAVDPAAFFPDKRYEFFPVDFRYGQPAVYGNRGFGELYKTNLNKAWLRIKLGYWPTDRELNAFAYGRWPIEKIQDPSMWGWWTTHTKEEWFKLTHPPKPIGI